MPGKRHRLEVEDKTPELLRSCPKRSHQQGKRKTRGKHTESEAKLTSFFFYGRSLWDNTAQRIKEESAKENSRVDAIVNSWQAGWQADELKQSTSSVGDSVFPLMLCLDVFKAVLFCLKHAWLRLRRWEYICTAPTTRYEVSGFRYVFQHQLYVLSHLTDDFAGTSLAPPSQTYEEIRWDQAAAVLIVRNMSRGKRRAFLRR